jgi:membrane-bound lytic murein transglycosylase D
VATVCLMLFPGLFPGALTAGELNHRLEPADHPSLISSLRVQRSLDFCGEPVPLEIPDVRERLEKELLLTLADRPQVILWIKRSHRYLDYIDSALKEQGLPPDLKYVAIAESALRPHVGSPAGAIGFWQFMPDTGRAYGLRIDDNYDDRRNLFKSTQAATAYFKDLYSDFNSWTLAAAAFNMGEEGLQSEIILQKTDDYYRLYLSLETQRYLFRILSAKLILSEPEAYGFRLTKADLYPPVEFDRVEVVCPQKTPIHVIAQAAGTYFKRIKDLNPDIRGHYLPEGTHTVLVPKGAALDFQPRFVEAYRAWAADPDRYVHVVKSGENLSTIADRYGVPLQALIVWNDLNLRQPIHPGDRLVIYTRLPVPPEDTASD